MNSSSEKVFVRVLNKVKDARVDDADEDLKSIHKVEGLEFSRTWPTIEMRTSKRRHFHVNGRTSQPVGTDSPFASCRVFIEFIENTIRAFLNYYFFKLSCSHSIFPQRSYMTIKIRSFNISKSIDLL